MKELSEGADLWVIPDRQNSNWSASLDWYLQFQISKAFARQPQQVPSELHDLAEQAEIELLPSAEMGTVESEPLLIHTAPQLPNRQTLHVPFSGNLKTWLKTIHEIWIQLKEPSLRIYLPRGIRLDQNSDLKILSKAEFFADKNLWA